MKVISSEKAPIKLWTDLTTVEPAAVSQLKNIANLPFIFKHVSVMPDVHLGKGATVGSVIATKNAVVPAAVGVDIGCGMMAIKTTLNANLVQDKAQLIRQEIEAAIPVGFHSNKDLTPSVQKWEGWKTFHKLTYNDTDLQKKAMKQVGTLGGGNHFIELCLDTENNVWVMLHSGSRNIGKTLAERHINDAKDLMKKMFINLPDPDLAYLVADTLQFDMYWNDLQWCQEYAYQNRIEMMGRIINILHNMFGDYEKLIEINCHHNYSALENHYGQNVFVTRKGAVRARENDYGIIPGSMGTRSYIVKGKGNGESFCSCSHGAGRRMSRNEARKTFTTEDLVKQTDGVECRKDDGVVDEIPGAYKDIDVVMEQQKDLVEVITVLKQFMCIKG